MKKNFKTLAIIFSMVLNIVFIGSYFYHQSDLFPLTGHRTNHRRILYEELNLSRQQLDRSEAVSDSFHAFVSQQGRKIKARQLELIDLLTRENPDRKAVTAKQEQILALQHRMQAKVIDHLLEESAIFTPAQRQKFFALIKGRIEKSSGPSPRWMPQTRENPSERVRR